MGTFFEKGPTGLDSYSWADSRLWFSCMVACAEQDNKIKLNRLQKIPG